ncbi:MAG TPA: prolipoprotein diacylglyceryl transferase family protein [Planctomycetota bacterium]|nr:prolipoprotein diacylglyceryl transferase family protein [Planctomycetota bacterium]
MTAYGGCLLAALVLAWWVARRSGEIEPFHVDRLAPLLVGAGLLGAWSFGWMGGGPGGSRGLFGALVAGVGAGIAYGVCQRLTLGRVGDAFAVPLALGVAVGRVGCFLEGCCRGTPTDLPWAVGGRQPAQLYESLGALALAGVVALARRRRRVPGEGFLAFGIGYGALRFALEPLRGNHVPWAEGLTIHQWLAALAAVACAALLVVRRRLYASSRSRISRRSSESPGFTG